MIAVLMSTIFLRAVHCPRYFSVSLAISNMMLLYFILIIKSVSDVNTLRTGDADLRF